MGEYRSHTNSIVVLVAAFGMMATLMSVEVNNLASWDEIFKPSFIGTLFAHIGTVIGAYVAGTLMPENRIGKMTRRKD